MVHLSRPYNFKFLKVCLPKIIHGPFLNTLFQLRKYSRRQVKQCSVKRVFLKIWKIHRKTPVSESLFNKVEGLISAILLKRGSNTSVFL